MTLSQGGESASSKSAMKTLAPELSALIIIFRSTGPVISTRRSFRSAGAGATVQLRSRICRVSARKSGSAPSRSRALNLCLRRWSSAFRRGPKCRASSSRKAEGSGRDDAVRARHTAVHGSPMPFHLTRRGRP